MARKTDGEKIDELEKLVAILRERVDYIRAEMIDRERFAVVEDRLNELKEAIRWRRSLWPPILAAIIGSILTLLGHALLK